jgi:signal transduction histidine kinase
VRHYFFISVLLISSGLIASGLLEIYFRYRENWGQIDLLHREIAAGATFKIEEFIQEIERTMKGATKSREIAVKGLSPEYKFELERLLLISPAITNAQALDIAGAKQATVSRLTAAFGEAKQDLSNSAAFQHARRGESYFGPVYFVRGSEPYMIIAVPIERFAGEVIGVLQAEVNLKYVWEVVSDIKVGKKGYAYAVTRSGDLVSHPDISLVLKKHSVAQLEQVRLAVQPTASVGRPKGFVGLGLDGKKVFTSYARIPSLGWAVLIELPVQEAYGPLYASLLRTSSLLLIGLGMALLASLFVARRVVQPLRRLRQGVERIGRGDLAFRVELKTGDEIEVLADEFNKMTADLQKAYSGLEEQVKERTRELTVVNKKLEEASRHKSRFLANVSHELRTPLNSIIGFTRLVLRRTERQIPDLQRENLRKVLISSEHLLGLINGLLDLAKIEAGRLEVFAEPFRFEEIIQVATSTVEPMLKDGRVRLKTKIDPDIPPLNTDRDKLKQIVLNLLSNAAKFTEEGEINVSAWQHDGSLMLAVSDTGVGMTEEVLGYIFEEFRQAEMSSTGEYGGTGLGLAIVKRLVDLLGGEIKVESEVGKGSTFSIKLPVNLQGSKLGSKQDDSEKDLGRG